MIADAIYEALVDGVTPVERNTEEWLGELYAEIVAAGCPTATAAVRPAPYSGVSHARNARQKPPASGNGIRENWLRC